MSTKAENKKSHDAQALEDEAWALAAAEAKRSGYVGTEEATRRLTRYTENNAAECWEKTKPKRKHVFGEQKRLGCRLIDVRRRPASMLRPGGSPNAGVRKSDCASRSGPGGRRSARRISA